ncbi:hypothetical protein BH09MYX1_BH09MYX1_23460 [soil metagenome]
MTEEESVTVTWAKRNRWLQRLSVVPFALAGLLFAVTIATAVPVVAIAPHLIGLGVFYRFFLRRRNPLPELIATKATVRDGALCFADQRIPLNEIKNAVIVPGAPGRPDPQVLIERKRLGTPVRFSVANVDEARHVLRLVGWDASQRTLSESAMSWIMSHPLRVFGTIFGSMIATFILAGLAAKLAPPLMAFVPLILIAMAFFVLAPSRVTIGGDGVLLEWLRWKRFIAIGDLLSAHMFDSGSGRNRRVGVELLTKSGPVRVVLGGGWQIDKANALVLRIQEVKAAGDAAKIGETAATGFIDQITKAAKDTKDWLEELRALGSGERATHRVAPIAPEALLRVVEDPGAPARARVAAAVALKSSGLGDSAARVRVAAETAAQPKLRIALERSIDEDDAALIEAVDDLLASESKR